MSFHQKKKKEHLTLFIKRVIATYLVTYKTMHTTNITWALPHLPSVHLSLTTVRPLNTTAFKLWDWRN